MAELKAALAKAIIAVDPEGAEKRHQVARRDRRVVVTPEADGMASLWAMLTATQAVGAFTWLTRLARGLGRDDPRSMDARRADILAALLSGHLVVNPGTAADADTAADTGDRATYDPVTGQRLTGCGSTTDPSAGEEPAGSGSTSSRSTAGNTTAHAGPSSDETGGDSATTASAGRPIHPASAGKPLIQVVIPYSMLIGADDQPAHTGAVRVRT